MVISSCFCLFYSCLFKGETENTRILKDEGNTFVILIRSIDLNDGRYTQELTILCYSTIVMYNSRCNSHCFAYQ